MILVTGSTGYIGSQITYFLESNNIKYIGIDNFLHSSNFNIYNKKKFFNLNISNSGKIKKIIKKFNIKTVIHCAASSYVLEGEKNKKKYLQNNYSSTVKFINTCKNAHISNFIFLSSSNVYKPKNSSYLEKNKKEPLNIYGISKLKIENYLQKKRFKFLIILRLFNIIGLVKKFHTSKKVNIKYQRLITNFFKIKKLQKINIRYKLKKSKLIYPKRDFLDIKDLLTLIKKILLLVENNKTKKIILNVGSGKATSVYKIFKICKKKYRPNLKYAFDKITNKEIMNTKADIKKCKKILRWQPTISIENSLKSYNKFLK